MSEVNPFKDRFKSNVEIFNEKRKRRVADLPEEMPNWGAPAKWTSPEDMYNQFLDYVQYIDEHPFVVEDFGGKDCTIVELNRMRTSTLKHFCLYSGTIYEIFENYCKKAEYFHITTAIAQYFHNRNISGAAAGALNASIISKIEGLVERKSVDHNQTQKVVLFIPAYEDQVQLEAGDEDLIEGEGFEVI